MVGVPYNPNANPLNETGASATTVSTTMSQEQQDLFLGALNLTSDETSRLAGEGQFLWGVLGRNEDAQNKALGEIIGTRTPAELMAAMKAASPGSATLIDAIAADTELAEAAHNMVSKDPTALKGLQALTSEGSGVSPTDMITALQDGDTRKVMIEAMNITAENPDLDFDDFSEIINSGIDLKASMDPNNPFAIDETKKKRYADALGAYDLTDPRMAMGGMNWQEMLKMVVEVFANFTRDPDGTIMALADKFGLDFGAEGSVQRATIEGGIKNTAGLLFGGTRPGEQTMGDVFEAALPGIIKTVEDVSGETDRKATAAEGVDATAPQADVPATLVTTAPATTTPEVTTTEEPAPGRQTSVELPAIAQDVTQTASATFDDSANRRLFGIGVPGNLNGVEVATTKTAFLSNEGNGTFTAFAQGPAYGTPEYLTSMGLKPTVTPQEQQTLEDYDRRHLTSAPAPSAFV